MSKNCFLKVDGLSHSYNDTEVLSEVAFTLSKQEVLGVVGPSGSGKTTLLRILATVIKASEGTIVLDGEPLVASASLRQRIGYVTDPPDHYADTSLLDYLNFFARGYKIPKRQIRATVDRAIEWAGLQEYRERPFFELSLGEIQKLSIARAMMHEPELLIIDEPLNGLSPTDRSELISALRGLQDRGLTIICSASYLDEVSPLITHLALIDQGAWLGYGPLSAIRDELERSFQG